MAYAGTRGYRKIILDSDTVKREGIASGAITPGHLLERTSTALTFKVNATANDGRAEKIFAIEDETQGKTIADAYATGARIFYHHPVPGDKVVARIKQGEDISRGDDLVSGGDGTLQKAGTDSSALADDAEIIAVADEDCDMSDSSGVDIAGGLCAVIVQ
jgi:hypothetical protein